LKNIIFLNDHSYYFIKKKKKKKNTEKRKYLNNYPVNKYIQGDCFKD